MKADAWRCMDRSRKLASKYPVNHLEPSFHSPLRPWAARRSRLGGLPVAALVWERGIREADAWRCMDRSRKIGKQMTGQPFGAIIPLAPPGLGLPGGSRLAGSWQRLSLGGSGFVKADAWRCMDWSRKLARKEPISHLEPARHSPLWPWAARRALASVLLAAPLVWGGFVKADAWRCRDRSRKIGKQIAGQPFGASAPLVPPGLACPAGPGWWARKGHLLGGARSVKANTWRCMDWSRKIGKQRAGQPFGAIMPLAPPGLACPAGPGWQAPGSASRLGARDS